MGDHEKERWNSASGATARSGNDQASGALAAVEAALDRLSYGAIQLTVHDGKVVQLDVTEKRRFPS